MYRFDPAMALEITGWIGATILLMGYTFSAATIPSSRARWIHSLNIAGATGIAANAWWHGALPSFALNAVLVMVGFGALAHLAGFWNVVPMRFPRWKWKPLPKLATVGVPKVSDELFAERGRAVDQIKRLYAVVMGFAATECIRNVTNTIKLYEYKSPALLVYGTFGLCIVSLMILFFLGSERYFDRRYLRKNHVHVTQQGLGFDIIVLIVTSGWFVLLAESFPKTLGVSIKQDIINSRFLTNLYILYIIDLVILIIQVVRTHLTMEKSLNRDKIILAHYGWIISNMLFIMAFSPYIFNKWKMPSPESIWIMLGTAHLARFILDFGYAFPFYYPVDEESMAE